MTTDIDTRTTRQDGWTPERQRTFLEHLADGHSVLDACKCVGMTHQSAYALRRRAAGAAFALGWRAALLHARHKLADALLVRAIEGQVETTTRDDGRVVERHKYDNRLATAMLTRLDAQAEADGATHHAARIVAGDFDGFLDLVGRGAAPARAGLFLGLRAASESDDPDLDPVAALARADRYCRARAGTPQEVDVSDLDPADRAHWTAADWTRAEAAGLVALAPESSDSGDPDTDDGTPQLPQLSDFEEPDPVWWEEEEQDWCTGFPPPEGFDGVEVGSWGDDDYYRTLAPDERAVTIARHDHELAEDHAEQVRDRDAWFADTAETDDETGHAFRRRPEPGATNARACEHKPATAKHPTGRAGPVEARPWHHPNLAETRPEQDGNDCAGARNWL